MTLRPRAFRLLVLLLCLVPLPLRAAPGAAARGIRFTFAGRVEEPSGRPVRGATLLLQGLAETPAVTDADGRFDLAYAVRDLPTPDSAPLRLVLRARHKDWNLGLISGAAALVIELRQVRTAEGGAQFEVRSNDAGVAGVVAAALRAPGEPEVALSCDFLRWLGGVDDSEPALTALEVVSLGARPSRAVGAATAGPPARVADSGPPVVTPPRRTEVPDTLLPGPTPQPVPAPPAQGRPPATTRRRVVPPPRVAAPQAPRRSVPAPEPPRAAPVSDTTTRSLIQVSVRPDTAAPASAAKGADGAPTLRVALGRALSDSSPGPGTATVCDCPVRGTVEARLEKPLSGTTWVIVSLADAPAFRDSVALFMGPPRPFDLGRVPCGTHRLDVQPRSSRRLTVLPPVLSEFVCTSGRLQQFRVILEPH